MPLLSRVNQAAPLSRDNHELPVVQHHDPPLIDRKTPRALEKTFPGEHSNDATTIYNDNHMPEPDKPHHPLHCPLGTTGLEIPLAKQPNKAKETDGLDVAHEHHDPSKNDPVYLAHHDPIYDEVSPTRPLTKDPTSLLD